MLNVHELKAQDLQGLSPSSLAEVAAQMLRHIGQQSSRIDWQSKQIAERDRAIKFKDVKTVCLRPTTSDRRPIELSVMHRDITKDPLGRTGGVAHS